MDLPEALFLDIDGTILRSDHSLSPRVIRAIRAISAAGTLVILASGRSWESIKPFYKRLHLSGPSVCCNGAMVVEGLDGVVAVEFKTDEKVARFAIAEAQNRHLEILAYRKKQLLYEREGPEIQAYRRRVPLSPLLINFDLLDELSFTKMIVMADHEKLIPIKTLLEKEFPPEILSATFSEPQFLELMGGYVDKGRGLRKACHLCGVNPSKSVGIGDGWNDLALFDFSGDPWVMGGASEELKSRFPRNRIALHADQDGVAVVLEGLLAKKNR